LAALLRPALRLSRPEFSRTHLAGEGTPVRTGAEGRVDLTRREPERGKLRADAHGPLTATRVVGDVGLREARIVEHSLVSQCRKGCGDGSRLKAALLEPATELPACEIAPREQCDRLGPRSLGVGAPLRLEALAPADQAVFAWSPLRPCRTGRRRVRICSSISRATSLCCCR